MIASIGGKSVDFANSEAGYVTIHVTKFRRGVRNTGNGMPRPSQNPSFGNDLVEAMKVILAHYRGEIEVERVMRKRRSLQATPKQTRRRAE